MSNDPSVLRAARETDYGTVVWFVRETADGYEGIRKMASAHPDRPMTLSDDAVEKLVAEADTVEWVAADIWANLESERD
jgi:hypothetical protein